MLIWGMGLQGIALIAMFWAVNQIQFIILAALLGAGTAIVYPTFLSAISGFTNRAQRAHVIGIFRLWKDLGYAFCALLAIGISIFFEMEISIISIGILTFISSLTINLRMDD